MGFLPPRTPPMSHFESCGICHTHWPCEHTTAGFVNEMKKIEAQAKEYAAANDIDYDGLVRNAARRWEQMELPFKEGLS